MGFMDELKRLAHPYEDDEDELDEYEDGSEEVEEKEEAEPPRRKNRTERTASRTGSAAGGSYFESDSRDAKVVNITNPSQMQVILVEPKESETVESMREIANHLLKNHTVVLNLEKTDDATVDHLLFFMGGVAYAVRGNLKRVAERTFIVMPSNVNMEGKLRDELESSGWIF